VTEPVKVPWSTGFETGLCDWDRAQGFCYVAAGGTFELVSSPTRGGSQALAFNVTADGTGMSQARCVREGALPQSATYGAWFYVPASATSSGNWNLMHFQGGQPGGTLLPWWDVSLANAPQGLLLQVVNYVGMSKDPVTIQQGSGAMAVPIGSWFHVEFRWRRATDATGEITLFQNGRQVVHLAGIATDDADWGQWYVGNLADALDPPDSTVYVDDVSIRASSATP
jgi:hypothetical protein